MNNPTDFEPQIRRIKKRRRTAPPKDDGGFLTDYGIDLLLVIGLLAGGLILTSPWHHLFPTQLFMVGGLLLVAVFAGGLFRVRHHLLHSARFNEASPCRSCGHIGLKRTPRQEWHRFLERLTGLPIRHYICPQCTYKTIRLDNSKSHR